MLRALGPKVLNLTWIWALLVYIGSPSFDSAAGLVPDVWNSIAGVILGIFQDRNRIFVFLIYTGIWRLRLHRRAILGILQDWDQILIFLIYIGILYFGSAVGPVFNPRVILGIFQDRNRKFILLVHIGIPSFGSAADLVFNHRGHTSSGILQDRNRKLNVSLPCGKQCLHCILIVMQLFRLSLHIWAYASIIRGH